MRYANDEGFSHSYIMYMEWASNIATGCCNIKTSNQLIIIKVSFSYKGNNKEKIREKILG